MNCCGVSLVPRFRKKPVVIEAQLFVVPEGSIDYRRAEGLARWCGGSFDKAGRKIVIPTLEGPVTASSGDWIIRGVQGEFYPCKPDIFDATYEAVDV
jgi:hypothetical protein